MVDLLVLGLEPNTYPLFPQTRKHINVLGIQVEIQDTRNAAAQFNLLATERGMSKVRGDAFYERGCTKEKESFEQRLE